MERLGRRKREKLIYLINEARTAERESKEFELYLFGIMEVLRALEIKVELDY